ncbi:hypothetical protein LMG33818_001637 [Halomonadaceae bacterium LMG 33818]|uniref:LTA synthase family protein n=1 Tax=Cernens ardua TaxID=3402176 RepID=UPI003EDBBF5E
MLLFSLWMPLVVSLVLWCTFEQLLIPRPHSWMKRPRYATAIDVGTWACLYGGFTLLLERGWFATIILGVLHMVIVQVSNTKANTLREPFLCQDFEYFVDMVKHPRMYLPFFGIGLTIVCSLAGLAVIIAGFWLEPSLFTTHGWGALTSVLGIIIAGAIILSRGLKGSQSDVEQEQKEGRYPLDPNDELIRYGMSTLLWRQGKELFIPLSPSTARKEYQEEILPSSSTHQTSRQDAISIRNSEERPEQGLPHLVIVQSESFFDPRRWYHGIRKDVLAEWDKVAAQAEVRGQLKVPVWGANTVRSECAFLTGLSGGDLGGHRFNPYHVLSHQKVPSLITPLKASGYRTIAIHPYPASFYLRNKVFPNLGFDEFIDLSEFSDDQKDGQYTSDLALADTVDKLLEKAEQPLLIMLITMENHGPLHLEHAPTNPDHWYSESPGADCDDLAVYLRHLHNSGLLVERLTQRLGACSKKEGTQGKRSLDTDDGDLPPSTHTQREGILCFYGDHVPIMASTYKALGYPDGLTEYFIWSTQGKGHKTQTVASIEDLGIMLLDSVSSHISRNIKDADTAERSDTENYS